MLLLFCDRFPQEVPEDPKELSKWVRDTTALAEAAVKRLSEVYPGEAPKQLKITHLQALHFKDEKCPEGTPQYARSHFGFALEGRISPVPRSNN